MQITEMEVKSDRAAIAVGTVRDKDVDKCDQTPIEPLVSQAFEETVETADNLEEEDNVPSFYAESVASECSMESDASSNAPDGDSQDSDADSPSQFCEEKIPLKRCPSGGSIVTYDEAASKLPEVGECERTGDRKASKRLNGSQTNGLDDEQEASINAGLKMAESAGQAWTDDKHCSYLNSMEQTFVQSLYGQDYHALDASGQDDQDCVESRPMYGSRSEIFTSLQRGCYDHREYYRPQALPKFGPSTTLVFRSPWIQHFNPRTHTPSHGGAAADGDTYHPSTVVLEEVHCGSNAEEGVKEEVMESFPDLPEACEGAQGWNSRFQSQHRVSTNSLVRADASMQAKKRTNNLDSGNDVMYRPKKLKATQRLLAEIDLEMEEQFRLKQKQAEKSHSKEDPQRLENESGGLDLNQALVNVEGMEPDESHSVMPVALPILPKFTNFITSAKEPGKSRKKVGSSVMDIETTTCLPKSHRPNSIASDAVLFKPLKGGFGEGSSGINKLVNAPTGAAEKLCQDEADADCQADVGLCEDEEFEILLRRSPRASKTYKWGGTIGPRRRLHNESNVLVEATVLSGSVKDIRDEELQNKDCEQ